MTNNNLRARFVEAFLAGTFLGAVLGLVFSLIILSDNENRARCKSLGGKFGNSKCFVDGKSV